MSIARWLLAICLGVIITIVSAQEETPEYGIQIHERERVSDGYVLFTPIASPMVYLIDNDGNLINEWEISTPARIAYLLENGQLVVPIAPSDDDESSGGRIEQYTWEGDLLWSYTHTTPNERLHHDIEPLPNGNILATVWEMVTPEDAFAMGFLPEIIGADVVDNENPIRYDKIIEIDPHTNEIVWSWRFLDHTIQDEDDTLPNYGIPAAHPERIDLNYDVLGNQTRSRTHLNAITYHADDNLIMVSSRIYSEIWMIDHATGALVYRWGNPATYGRGIAENQQLFAQHDPHWLDNGNVLIFNNGIDHIRPFSTVIEMTPPERNAEGQFPILVGAPFAPADIAWEYRADPETDFFATVMSGAHRTPIGNTFITASREGHLFEVTRAGDVVWSYLNPVHVVNNADEPRRTTIFRATRYPADYTAFSERDLTPRSPLSYTILPLATTEFD